MVDADVARLTGHSVPRFDVALPTSRA